MNCGQTPLRPVDCRIENGVPAQTTVTVAEMRHIASRQRHLSTSNITTPRSPSFGLGFSQMPSASDANDQRAVPAVARRMRYDHYGKGAPAFWAAFHVSGSTANRTHQLAPKRRLISSETSDLRRTCRRPLFVHTSTPSPQHDPFRGSSRYRLKTK